MNQPLYCVLGFVAVVVKAAAVLTQRSWHILYLSIHFLFFKPFYIHFFFRDVNIRIAKEYKETAIGFFYGMHDIVKTLESSM